MKVSLVVNGSPREVDLPPLSRLLDALRGPLGLTGTKEGCAEGECGACTVLLDGDPVNACLIAIGQCEGRHVTTVEGLAQGGQLHPIQQAFHEEHGLQCGYCTPGMMLTSVALLEENPSPTDEEIRFAISGQICRCTGYQNIVKAVQSAAAVLREA